MPATLHLLRDGAAARQEPRRHGGVLGAREAAIAKELTKLHESVTRGPLDRLATEVRSSEALKGEFVVVVAPPHEDKREPQRRDDRRAAREGAQLESFRDAVRSVAEVLKSPRPRLRARAEAPAQARVTMRERRRQGLPQRPLRRDDHRASCSASRATASWRSATRPRSARSISSRSRASGSPSSR